METLAEYIDAYIAGDRWIARDNTHNHESTVRTKRMAQEEIRAYGFTQDDGHDQCCAHPEALDEEIVSVAMGSNAPYTLDERLLGDEDELQALTVRQWRCLIDLLERHATAEATPR